jgi:uncharacterized protein
VSTAASEPLTIPNPFTYGRPITEPAHFAGRQLEARDIYSRLGNIESSSVLGERRIGKTSFLKYISHSSTVRKFGLDPDRYLFIFVDLQGYDHQETSDVFWCDVLDEIEAQAKDDRLQNTVAETRTQPSLGTRELGDLLDSTGRQGQRVVLLLDEFENVTRNPKFDVDFFNRLRSLAIHHNLALITSSRRELVELCYSREVASSPFFNIFANIDLGLLTQDEGGELMDKVLTGTPVSFDQVERGYLQQMTGRHPFFLQMAAHFLFESHFRQLNRGDRFSFTRQQFDKQAAPHFLSYWHHSDDDEQITLMALALLNKAQRKDEFDVEELKGVASQSDRVLRRLARRALLFSTGGRYALFSPLFGEWIISEMLDPLGRPDQMFEEWLRAIEGRAETAKALEEADKQTVEALSKVKREHRGLITRWLHDEAVGNVVRILSFIAEVVRILHG